VRAFSGASLVGLVFSTAFGAMLLSIVLWCQNVWGWSALQAGLAIAPGPLMVPVFSFLVAGRLIGRFGAAATIALGATIFAGGAGWWTASATALSPGYVTDVLPGMLLTGVGVGLTLPTFMATAASSLPPASFATGSGVVNMMRQVGLAVGVALLVAVLGNPATPNAAQTSFHNGWTLIAGISLLAGLVAVASLPTPWRRLAPASAGQPLKGD
jgi:MFS family permease